MIDFGAKFATEPIVNDFIAFAVATVKCIVATVAVKVAVRSL